MRGGQRDDDDHPDGHAVSLMSRRKPRGQALVEFALVLPFFALLLFGIIDLGRYVYTANTLNNAAREGARSATVGYWVTTCPTATDRGRCAVMEAEKAAMAVLSPSATAVCKRAPVGGGEPVTRNCVGTRPDDFVEVTVEAEFTLVTPLVAQLLGSLDISGHARLAVQS